MRSSVGRVHLNEERCYQQPSGKGAGDTGQCEGHPKGGRNPIVVSHFTPHSRLRGWIHQAPIGVRQGGRERPPFGKSTRASTCLLMVSECTLSADSAPVHFLHRFFIFALILLVILPLKGVFSLCRPPTQGPVALLLRRNVPPSATTKVREVLSRPCAQITKAQACRAPSYVSIVEFQR